MADERTYNDPAGGSDSEVGPQIRTDFYAKQALMEARREQYFSQLADVTSMPKNFGKKIKKYHYLPLLDDANLNDQGLDAAGATITQGWEVLFKSTNTSVDFAVEADADAVVADVTGSSKSGAGPWTVTWAAPTDSVVLSTEALAQSVQGATGAEGSVIVTTGGNLYGSSKDIGSIPGKMPVLSETGGRVNRVGFKRKEIEGSLEKYGFFDEYTQESLDFDTDAQLQMHINREMVTGANEITEDLLQIDLLNSAGVIRYAGDATADNEVDNLDEVTYDDLMRLAIDLDNNRTPKHTKVVTGTRMIDTKTLASARVLYCGSELLPTLKAMTDLHGNPAFIPVQQYAGGTTVFSGDIGVLVGEVGSIDNWRIIIVPEMMKWAGAGADASATATHHETGNQYDIFPMLTVGDESFTTIGFQTDGKTVKFKITHKPPGEKIANRDDPYGEVGFMSIKWYYGFLLQRPERIGLVKTAAKL